MSVKPDGNPSRSGWGPQPVSADLVGGPVIQAAAAQITAAPITKPNDPRPRPRNCQSSQRATPWAAGTTARPKPRNKKAGAANGAKESDVGAAKETAVTMVELQTNHFMGRFRRPCRRSMPPRKPQSTKPMQTARSAVAVAHVGQSHCDQSRMLDAVGRAGI